MPEKNLGWYDRGYIQHCDFEGAFQFITFHLADSLPKEVNLRLAEEKLKKDTNLLEALDLHLDHNYGSCLLKKDEEAQIVQDSLKHFDRKRYHLKAWVIMPNHVHVLIELLPTFKLSTIVQSWKKFTSNKINQLNNTKGKVWQIDYWDRYIRDENHLQRTVHYIEQNPVKAGLVAGAKDWPWSHLNS